MPLTSFAAFSAFSSFTLRNFRECGRSFLPREPTQRSWHWALPSFDDLTSPAPHPPSLSLYLSLSTDQSLLIRFLTLARSLLHQQFTHSHSLLAPTTLARNMKIKKLTTIIAVVPFGAATVLTAAGTAPYYSNASLHGTAVVVPYVQHLSLPWPLLPTRESLLPSHFTSAICSEGASVCPFRATISFTWALKRWMYLWTSQTTTPHPAQ